MAGGKKLHPVEAAYRVLIARGGGHLPEGALLRIGVRRILGSRGPRGAQPREGPKRGSARGSGPSLTQGLDGAVCKITDLSHESQRSSRLRRTAGGLRSSGFGADGIQIGELRLLRRSELTRGSD